MTKHKKIKITGLLQSPESLASKLQELKAVALRLLRETDYTQFPDSGLSLLSMIEYQVWRYKVRRLLLCEDKHILECILPELEKTKPRMTQSQSPLHVYTPTILFDDSSLASAKTAAIRIVRDYKRIMGKRYDEAQAYTTIDACNSVNDVLNYIELESVNGH